MNSLILNIDSALDKLGTRELMGANLIIVNGNVVKDIVGHIKYMDAHTINNILAKDYPDATYKLNENDLVMYPYSDKKTIIMQTNFKFIQIK